MKRLKPIGLILLSLCFSSVFTQNTVQHERLKVRNDFSNPEDVVKYYCSRDASGFVWSGLLEIERKAFTTWDRVPQSDTFYVAREYKVHPARMSGASANEAHVEVQYALTGIGDGNGTTQTPPIPTHKVKFSLKKTSDGKWKIVSPASKDIAPVVLEQKFSKI